tara:strand:+ start:240 stop:374 length:135 start_codon:yes stop_codon:yes gene_type:complete
MQGQLSKQEKCDQLHQNIDKRVKTTSDCWRDAAFLSSYVGIAIA